VIFYQLAKVVANSRRPSSNVRQAIAGNGIPLNERGSRVVKDLRAEHCLAELRVEVWYWDDEMQGLRILIGRKLSSRYAPVCDCKQHH
jgi:hypothetical protein